MQTRDAAGTRKNTAGRKQALVLGATGLVGKELVSQLLADPEWEQVVTLVRRPSGVSHARLTEHVVSFDQMEEWSHLLRGDVLFSALGTTRSTAGSQAAQYQVDYTYQHRVAEAAARQGVKTLVLVSSMGADPHSKIFYSRMKGELDRDVQSLGFAQVKILRPGPLSGQRTEVRLSEQLSLPLLRVLNALGLFSSLRPIPAERVAKAMRRAVQERSQGVRIFDAAELFEISADDF